VIAPGALVGSVRGEVVTVGARLARALLGADQASLWRTADACLGELAAFVDADRALVVLLDEHERVASWFSWAEAGRPRPFARTGEPLEELVGSAAPFLRIGRTVPVGDLSAVELSLAERQLAERNGGLPAATMVLPVLVGHDLVGVAVLESTEGPRTWTRQFVAEVEPFAELVVRMLGRTHERQLLAAATARARRIAAYLPDGLAMLSPDGVIGWASPSLCEMTGRPAAALEQGAFADLVSPADRARFGALLVAVGLGGDARGTFRIVGPSGEWRWCDLSCRLASEPGVPDEVVVTVRDSHERHLREQRLLAETDRDPLTRLANRGALERFLGEVASSRASAVVAFCDVDDFKAVNDRLGHDRGDQVLAAVAGAIGGAVRSGDMAARFGGDEFVVVLVDPGDEAGQLGARLVGAVRASLGGEVSVSVGVCGPGPAVEIRRLLRLADQAMYRAKRSGKDGWAHLPAPPG